MTTYGVTPTGFVRPSLQEILEAIERDQRALISEGLDQSPESPLGQINGIKARQLSMAWEALETAYNGFDPDRAEDFLLTALSKLTGTFRDAATKSTVLCTVNMNAGTTLVAGETYARVLGKPLVRFTPREDFTAPTTGVHTDILFEAEIPGPVEVAANQLSVIATITAGWNSVINPDRATPGEVAEEDPSLRTKREQDLARAGNQTKAAIKADLAALTHEGKQWVRSSMVFENVDNLPDGEGRDAHSFEVLVYYVDGEAPTDAEDQIAQVIWNNKPAGIKPWGIAESGHAINENGETVTVPFSRVAVVPIYVAATLTTVPGFVDQAKVKDEMMTKSNATFAAPGSDVVALYVRSLAFNVAGVLDVPTFTIGTAPSPVGTTNIAIGLRQVATFSAANIALPG